MKLLGKRGTFSGGILIAISLGCLFGEGGYTFWYAEGASYLTDNPKACTNCHVMREHYDSWQRASHHAVATCNDCHLPQDFLGKYTAKAVNGYFHSKGFTLQNFSEPIRIRPANAQVLQDNCIRCHQDMVGDLVHHGSFNEGGHRCVDCHGAAGHGPMR